MSGIASKIESLRVVRAPEAQDLPDFCFCGERCSYVEKVFASPESGYKSDFSSFLARRISLLDTINFQLFKNGSFVSSASTNAYGEFSAFAGSNSELSTWVIDWQQVYAALGGGQYQIRIDYTILGSSFSWESHYFQLYPYTPELANRTVRITGLHTGNIESSEFDFTDLAGGWTTYIRVPGTFGNRNADIEIEEYQTANRIITQNQTKVNQRYTLDLEAIPTSIFKRLINTDLLANEITVTDYDMLRDERDIIRELPVSLVSVDEQDEFNGSGKGAYKLTFTDRANNIIKRNF